jgi:hypothetical protein
VGNLLNGYFEAGQGRKLWITEMGSPERDLGDDRQQVGEFLRRYYRTMTAQFADKVEQLFWFCYSDGMVPTFGLLDEAGDPKPAFNVFRDVATSEVAFDLLTGVEPAATGESIPVTEALTPASSTFVVPFRQHVALEIARLESYIKLLQEQVKQLQERIQGLAGDEDE